MEYSLTVAALGQMKKLPLGVRRQLFKKFDAVFNQQNPLIFAKRLVGDSYGDYRLRVGDYRAIFDIHNQKALIVRVDHRKDIYR